MGSGTDLTRSHYNRQMVISGARLRRTLNEILNKREGGEGWGRKEPAEIGELERATPGRQARARRRPSRYFGSKRGCGRGLAKTHGVLGASHRPVHARWPRKTNIGPALHSPWGSLAHVRSEGSNERTKKGKKDMLRGHHHHQQQQRSHTPVIHVHLLPLFSCCVLA